MQRDQLRASDEDREKVAEILRDAHAEGRLSRDEFDERLETTYQARTYQDLNGLLTDLPAPRGTLAIPSVSALRPSPSPVRKSARRAARKTLNVFWWIYSFAVMVNVVIWGSVTAFTEQGPPFWPIFIAGPWGVILLFGEFAYRTSATRE